MKRLEIWKLYCFVIVFLFTANIAIAAPVSQSFNLHAGWNAVLLEVNPDPAHNDPASVFGTVPDLISVWRWNADTSTVEFVQNPDVPVPEQSTWLVYYHNTGTPPSALESMILTDLHAVHGNAAYLIQRGGTGDVSFTVTGEPAVQDIYWQPNTYNLVGFNLISGSEPSYGEFFSSSAAHADQKIYVLQNGTWVEALAVDAMAEGEAFWIYCQGSSTFNGPVSVRPEVYSALDYGTQLDEQNLILENNDDEYADITVNTENTFSHLYYLDVDDNGVGQWVQFSGPGLTLHLQPGEKQRLRLGVKREGIPASQVLLTNLVVSNASQRVLLPVSVTGIETAGLWSGYAEVSKVSEVRKGTTPKKTGSVFTVRLLVHVDDGGNVKLLQQVIQMWQQGTWKADPDHPGFQIVDIPGHYVLLTDDSLVSSYQGMSLLDGKAIGRRVSSAAFSFTEPQPMTGSFATGQTLTTTITVAKDDPLNPFVHRYHPKHQKPVLIPADGEVPEHWSQKAETMFDISRLVTLQFGNNDPDGNTLPGTENLNWGSLTVGGIYRETIAGLNKNPIYIEGTFVLNRISDVSQITTTAP